MPFQNAVIAGIGIDPDRYHSDNGKRGTHEFVMSPSAINAFSKCPRRWLNGYQPPDTEAKDWGHLLDTRLLTPNEFDKRYALRPDTYIDQKTGEEKPWSGNSKVCKEWLEDNEGLRIATREHVALCDAAIRRLLEDEIIAAWHKASDTQVHVKGEWVDKNGMVIPVQCLIDYVPRLDTEFAKCLGDLKSTRNAAVHAFSRYCYQAGYHVQAAFDLDLYCAASGEDRNSWCFIVQENFEPWQTGRRLLSQDFTQIGRQTYQHALHRYAAALRTGQWPDYDDTAEAIQGWSLCQAEPFMEFQAISEQLEHTQEEACSDPNDVPS